MLKFAFFIVIVKMHTKSDNLMILKIAYIYLFKIDLLMVIPTKFRTVLMIAFNRKSLFILTNTNSEETHIYIPINKIN